jgi:hypothetical protein
MRLKEGKGIAVKRESLRFLYALGVIALRQSEWSESGAFSSCGD